jgi:hypothetical protein
MGSAGATRGRSLWFWRRGHAGSRVVQTARSARGYALIHHLLRSQDGAEPVGNFLAWQTMLCDTVLSYRGLTFDDTKRVG